MVIDSPEFTLGDIIGTDACCQRNDASGTDDEVLATGEWGAGLNDGAELDAGGVGGNEDATLAATLSFSAVIDRVGTRERTLAALTWPGSESVVGWVVGVRGAWTSALVTGPSYGLAGRLPASAPPLFARFTLLRGNVVPEEGSSRCRFPFWSPS